MIRMKLTENFIARRTRGDAHVFVRKRAKQIARTARPRTVDGIFDAVMEVAARFTPDEHEAALREAIKADLEGFASGPTIDALRKKLRNAEREQSRREEKLNRLPADATRMQRGRATILAKSAKRNVERLRAELAEREEAAS